MKNYFRKINDYRKENGVIKTADWLRNCAIYEIRTKNTKKRNNDIPTLDYVYNLKLHDNFIPKIGKRVFIFATVPFYDIGGGQRSSQFAKTFNKMGYEVFYIYAFKSSDSICNYIENPSCIHLFIEDFSIGDFENYIRKDDLVIFEAPCNRFIQYFEIAKKRKAHTIYENIDNWENKELGGILFSEDALKDFVCKCELLTCTAKPLVEQTKKYLKKYKVEKEILYVPNAVDDELFNGRKTFEKPWDLTIGKPTLIYYGSLWGSWFDWDTLFYLARNNPRLSINLIGDYECIKDIVSNSPNNIHYLGLKRQDELPAYLYHSDYAILPFYSDDIGKYVSPLKIFEYIAMNKKIISTKLPDIANYPNVEYVENLEDWENVIKNPKDLDKESSEKFIMENNWYSRISSMLQKIYEKESKKCDKNFYDNLSVVVLNYNNSNVIFRCIDTLKKYNKRYNYEIIVVDNQSSDGSYEKLMNDYNGDNIKVIRNSKNGCSSGRNLGVEKSTKEYIIFLDSDEWITNDYWLDNYFEILNRTSDKTVVGWGAGWFNEEKIAYHVVDSFAHRYLPPQYIATNDIGYLATCGFIIKKDFFFEIGGFDEAYDPTCYEDTDLSLAVRNAGGEIYYSKYLGVGHLPHQTTKSGTKEHDELIRKKGIYFISKWSKKNEKLITKYIK